MADCLRNRINCSFEFWNQSGERISSEPLVRYRCLASVYRQLNNSYFCGNFQMEISSRFSRQNDSNGDTLHYPFWINLMLLDVNRYFKVVELMGCFDLDNA